MRPVFPRSLGVLGKHLIERKWGAGEDGCFMDNQPHRPQALASQDTS